MADEKIPATKMEETEVNGQKGWRYSDGSIRGEGGRLLAKHPRATSITPETSHEMRARRVSLSQEKTRLGIAAGLNLDLSKASGGEEWQLLTQVLTERFRESKNIRGLGEAYSILGKASGHISNESKSNSVVNIVTSLAKLFQAFMDREVVEGEVKDVE